MYRAQEKNEKCHIIIIYFSKTRIFFKCFTSSSMALSFLTWQTLLQIILDFKDIIRVCLGADHPVNVPPMEIKFEKDERPVKVRQRTYSPEQLDFMKEEMRRTSGSGIHLSQSFLEVGMCSSHRVRRRIREISLYRRSPSCERSNQEQRVADALC